MEWLYISPEEVLEGILERFLKELLIDSLEGFLKKNHKYQIVILVKKMMQLLGVFWGRISEGVPKGIIDGIPRGINGEISEECLANALRNHRQNSSMAEETLPPYAILRTNFEHFLRRFWSDHWWNSSNVFSENFAEEFLKTFWEESVKDSLEDYLE